MLFQLALSLAPLAPADVLVVDPSGAGDFLSAPEAVAAAQEGDTLLLKTASNLFPIEIDGKSLALVADVGAAYSSSPVTVRNLGPDQRVVLQGLTLAGTSVPLGASSPALSVIDCEGLVQVDGCSLSISAPAPFASGIEAARVVRSEAVVLVDSLATGITPNSALEFDGRPALVVTESSVSLFGCTLTGGAGFGQQIALAFAPDGGDGAAALVANGSELLVVGSTLIGGAGGKGADTPGSIGGICSDGGDGGAGALLAASTLRRRDAILQGGAAGVAGISQPGEPTCSSGQAGLDVDLAGSSLVDFSGSARGFAVSPNPVREGETVTVQFAGEPDDLVIWGLSAQPTVPPLLDLGGLQQLGAAVIVLTPGFIPPSGELSLDITLQDFAPQVEGLGLFEQAIHLTSTLTVVPSTPRFVLHLDQSF